MSTNDLHTSLKSEVIENKPTSYGEAIFARQAWSKTQVRHSVHVAPNTYSVSGLQWPDFFSYLGFTQQTCTYIPSRKCFAMEVGASFDLTRFNTAVEHAFRRLELAQKLLESCGYLFDQPEGWGFFFGKSGGGRSGSSKTYYGDGHTSGPDAKIMKNSEDSAFKFLFSWIKTSETEKGWTIHYQPKHLPLSTDVASVFKFLGVSEFNSCPNFDFEPCWWKHIEYVGGSHFESNVQSAYRAFEAHEQNFSKGIEALLDAQSSMETVGMGFLPIPPPSDRLNQDIKKIASKPPEKNQTGASHEFDVAISFAGPNRPQAEELANKLRADGFSVFYDHFFPEQLWGKNLVEFFHNVYSKGARYCVVFVSKDYLDSEWTVHERQSAQERMLKEKGNEYILPIKMGEVELPGIPSTIGYLSISIGIDKIFEALKAKLRKGSS